MQQVLGPKTTDVGWGGWEWAGVEVAPWQTFNVRTKAMRRSPSYPEICRIYMQLFGLHKKKTQTTYNFKATYRALDQNFKATYRSLDVRCRKRFDART